MDDKQCKDYRYFLQHYTFDSNKIIRIHCGHCIRTSVKQKRPFAKGCEHFDPRHTDEQPFVSKEHLSKALLEYMLKLDLLPEIGEYN